MTLANACFAQSTGTVKRDSIMADVSAQNDNYAETIVYLLSYLKCRPPGDTSEYLANVYANLSGQYRQSGKAELAVAYADTSYTILEKLPETQLISLAHVKFQRAVAYYEINRNDLAAPWINSAINLLNESIAKGEEGGDVIINAYHLNALKIAFRNDDISLAKYHAASIKNLSDHENDQWVAESLPYYYAIIESKLGNYSESIPLFKKYIRDFEVEDKGYRVLTVGAMVSMSTDYFDLKDYDTAQYYLEAAIARVDSMEFTPWIHGAKADAVSNLIMNSQYTTKRKNIDSLLRVAKYHALQLDPKGRRGLGIIFANAAITNSAYGNHKRANELFDSAFQNLSLGTNYIAGTELPRIKENTFTSDLGIKVALNNRQNAYVMEAKDGYRKDGLQMAKRAYESIDSLMWYRRSRLSLTSSINYQSNGVKKSIEDGVALMMSIAREENNDSYLTNSWHIVSKFKSDILTRHINGQFWAEVANLPPALVEQKENLEDSLAELEDRLLSDEAKQPIRDAIFLVNDSIKLLNEKILVDYPAFSTAIQGYGTVDPQQASRQLAGNELMIEYFVGQDTLYIFALGNEVPLQVFSRKIPDNFKATITRVTTDSFAAQQLYDLLIKPVISAVTKKITRLHIIPDGLLWNLPFSALLNNGRYLIRDFATSYAYSAGLLFDEKLRKEVQNTQIRFAGFGLSYDAIIKNIQENGSRSSGDRNLLKLAGLPYAKDEVIIIGKLTKGDTWLDEAATKKQFINAIPGHQQLHLAMHGLTDPDNPMENALVFASDSPAEKYALLTTREILAQKIPARLTVLSACHTGAGPLESSEGIQSMARAFTFAGVKATLSSRWEASDKVTHDILIRFYEELEKGESLDRAQQIATLAYLDQASPADQRPELWANLTLTGFNEPLNTTNNQWWMYLGIGVIGLLIWWLTKQFE